MIHKASDDSRPPIHSQAAYNNDDFAWLVDLKHLVERGIDAV